MIEIDTEKLAFIYNKLKITSTPSVTYSTNFRKEDDEIITIKFDIFYSETEGWNTNILNNDNGSVPITADFDLDIHFEKLQLMFKHIRFCNKCERMTTSDNIFQDMCTKCVFRNAFSQNSYNDTCVICQYPIHNDFLKVTCCGGFFHKCCRIKYGKWQACPLCRSENFSY